MRQVVKIYTYKLVSLYLTCPCKADNEFCVGGRGVMPGHGIALEKNYTLQVYNLFIIQFMTHILGSSRVNPNSARKRKKRAIYCPVLI